jgi:ribosomal protein S18 acetylase RimI-like enzyme
VPELIVPTAADAERIAALINARFRALHGVSEETAQGVAEWFDLPFLDAEADMRLAVGPDGAAEGYADVSLPEDGTPPAMIDVRVRPEAAEALSLLLAWAQERAAERVGAEGRIQIFADRDDHPLSRSLGEAGYAVVRSAYEMERSIEGELEPAIWPDGLEVRTFDLRDGEAVHAAQDEAFAGDWFYHPVSHDVWLKASHAAGVDSGLSSVVWAGDAIAGLCLTRPAHGEDESTGWIGDLAVRAPWRRQGLGEALLRHSFVVFAQAGKRAAGLGVDRDNATGALALYEKVGLRVVRQSDTWERTE